MLQLRLKTEINSLKVYYLLNTDQLPAFYPLVTVDVGVISRWSIAVQL